MLSELTESVGATAANLLAGRPGAPLPAIAVAIGMDDATLTAYNEHFVRRDTRMGLCRAQAPGWVFTHARGRLADEAFLSTEFYYDFLRPLDLFYETGGVLIDSTSGFSSVGIHRPRSRGEFTDEDIRLLETVLPHLRRAITLHMRLDLHHGLELGLDRLPIGYLLVDAHARVTYANAAAETLLRRRDGLRSTSQGLAARTPEETSRLRQLIGEAARGSNAAQPIEGSAGAMALTRPPARPLSVVVWPASPSRHPFSGADASLFVADPDHVAVAPLETLRSLYALTSAEARLVECLIQGLAVTEAAERLGVRRETVRKTLKSVLHKTGSARQSELLKLIYSGPAVLCRP